MLPQSVSDHYRAQQRLIVSTLGLVRREWRGMGDDLDASWAQIGPRIALLTASAQLGAATAGARYVPEALAELDQSVTADGEVNPRAMVGAQSLDGLTYGSLDDLLYGAVIRARTASAGSLSERLAIGGNFLDTLVHTQVSDASKQAASVAMTARQGVGYVRGVNPPCCQRCAVLANTYSAPTAFKRHPRCDCVAVPTTDPRSLTMTDVSPDQIKDLTKAQRQAIADGGDMNQVINSHRVGARSKDGMSTTEGTTRRGYASHVQREVARLRGEVAAETATNVGQRGFTKNYVERRTRRATPEAIYRIAGSREEAIRLLAANGYIVGDIRQVARTAL